MDVRLPDGTVVQNVPDGITKSALVDKLSQNGYDTSWANEEASNERAHGISSGMGIRHDNGSGTGGTVVPEWGREHPNLYGIAGAAREALGPILETGGMVGGALAGTAAGGPIGGAAGGSLGYAGARNLVNAADVALGNRPAMNARQLMSSALGDIKTGAENQMGGEAIGPAISRGASLVANKLIYPVIGDLESGAGANSLRQAVEAGKKGGEAQRALVQNMRGQVPMTNVVQDAKNALNNFEAQRNSDYLQGMQNIAGADSPMNFERVDQAYKNLVDSMKFKGQWKVGPETQAKIQQIGSTIDGWRQNPELHTTLGFDALKQQIGDLMPNKLDAGQGRRAVTTMYNSIKGEIQNANPEYADVMNNYAKSMENTKEIARELSLGDRNSEAQGLRKLQSVVRNNANTNWGHRIELINQLEKESPQIMNQVAGQSLNSWEPRGLTSRLMAGGMLGGSLYLHQPHLLPLLALQSPRLTGEGAVLAGKALGATNRMLPESARALMAKALLNQTNQ